MKSKILKWSVRIIIALILLVLIVLSGFALVERITFLSFYSGTEPFEDIPGLWEGYIPQGYIDVDDTDMRLACGYMKDGEASRIYVLKDGEEAAAVIMKNADGSDYTGHTGSLDVLGDYVYVTGKTGCDIFSLSDITDGDGIATQTDSVATINDPAYLVIKDNKLYTGSFYHEGDYETPSEHRMTTPAGDSNTAIISVYSLDPETGKTLSDIPELIISTPSFAQGMTFIDDSTVAIATSYGLSKSHILIYDLNKAVPTDGACFSFDGNDIPLIYLDSHSLTRDIVAPPMAEQIFYSDGRIYIMNESASMKYLFGKLTSGNRVYCYKYL